MCVSGCFFCLVLRKKYDSNSHKEQEGGQDERDKRFKEYEGVRQSIKLFLVDTAVPRSRHFASEESFKSFSIHCSQ